MSAHHGKSERLFIEKTGLPFLKMVDFEKKPIEKKVLERSMRGISDQMRGEPDVERYLKMVSILNDLTTIYQKDYL